MEFLGIGYQEILLVFALIMIVVGPRRLPEMAYYIGRFIRKLQGYARVVRDEFGEEFAYINEEMEAVRADVREVRGSVGEVREELRQVRGEVEEAGEEARDAAAPADASADGASAEPPRGMPGPAHLPRVATIEARDAFARDGGEPDGEPERDDGAEAEAASGKPLVF